MTDQFTEMVAQFTGLILRMANGRHVTLNGEDCREDLRIPEDRTELSITDDDNNKLLLTDDNGVKIVEVRFFDYRWGQRGEDLRFMYDDVFNSDDYPVLPVALPGDALGALTWIRGQY